MSTLSERLRTGVDDPGIFDEAADELDRLTARVAELEKLLREMVDLCELCDINETMEPDGYGWKSAYMASRAALEAEHG